MEDSPKKHADEPLMIHMEIRSWNAYVIDIFSELPRHHHQHM
jgi:hypothetical protein